MARVFSYESIQAGRVPDAARFALADKVITGELKRLTIKEELYGAVKFGSAARGELTSRSDYDLFVVVRNEQGRLAVRDLIHSIYGETGVIVEPVLGHEVQARIGSMPIHASLRGHLARMAQGQNVIGQNPLDILPPPRYGIWQDFLNYLDGKTISLNKKFNDPTQSERLKLIQRALETPVSTGRIVLEALSEVRGVPILGDDDRKVAVIAAFRVNFSDPGLVDGFESILNQDRIYNGLLESAIQGNCPRQIYDEGLAKIEGVAVIASIRWVESLGLLVSNAGFIDKQNNS